MPAARGGYDYLKPEVLRAIGRMDLRARVLAEGFLAGLHKSLARGFSAEFAGHRRYVGGEPARAVDWTVWARTNRLYVREFRADSSLQGLLLVDVSSSMGYGPGPVTKLSYATDLAGGLAYMMSRQGDPVGLLTLGSERMTGLRPSARQGQLVRVLQTLSRLTAHGRADIATSLEAARPYLGKRSFVVILSDLHPPSSVDRLERAFSGLHSRGHDVIVFHILDMDEVRPPFAGPIELEDVETGRRARFDVEDLEPYRATLESWRSRLALIASEHRIDYVPLDTGTPFGGALSSYLARRSGH
jgi:uncharacterized protein (DUF58 family)